MSDNDPIFRGDVKAFQQAVIHYSADYPDGHLVYAVTIKDIDCIPPIPHEMTAVEYAHHHGRMCSKAHIFCNNCPIYSANYDCVEFERDYPEEAVAIVEKWAKEHPERSEE